jgi:hypothetical protein
MIANSFRLTDFLPRSTLMTDCALARRLQVSTRMVRLWVDTGAWPLPCHVRRKSFLFRISDVERWLQTGVWPAGARFRLRGGPKKMAHDRFDQTKLRASLARPSASNAARAQLFVSKGPSRRASRVQPVVMCTCSPM